MNRYIAITLALLLTISIQAQKRISREYNNVSLSDALKQLAEQQTDYTIMFLYNELEDFRITTTIKNKRLPEAIQQMIGFYPIRVTTSTEEDGRKIFVECTHKTDRRLTGTIIDEQSQPVAYANVAILTPADSTLLSGGVSNESGYFAIPYEQHKVLARISYVGYKTIYKICSQPEVGTIRLQPETVSLKGVQVKGERIVSTTENGHLVYNMPMLLQVYPTDNAYDALTNRDAHHQRQTYHVECRQGSGATETDARHHAGQGRSDAVGTCEISCTGNGHQHCDEGLYWNKPTFRTTDGRLATAQVRYWICGWQRHL